MDSRQPLLPIGALSLALALLTGCSSASSTAASSTSAADSTAASAPSSAEPAAGSADSATTRTFTADNGEITIPVDPQRVVATGYAVPVLIEADANLVGISTWPRGLALMTPEDLATYEGLEKIGGAMAAETNYEAIASVKPDLIVIGVPKPVLADIDLKRLEAVAPVVAIGPTVPDAWRELSKLQADAAGALENFDAAQAEYEAKAAELKAKYATALAGLEFGHLGAYGEAAKGTFHREYAGSWGTNIAQDIGVTYYGEPVEKTGGSGDVSEYTAIEQLPASLGTADVITYSVQPDGTPAEAVQYVLDSELWKNLPAVQAGKVFAVKYTEAATFPSAMLTLDALDETLTPLLNQ